MSHQACPPEKIRNPATGRCVKRDGVIGRKLLAQLSPKSASPKKSVSLPVSLHHGERYYWSIDIEYNIEALQFSVIVTKGEKDKGRSVRGVAYHDSFAEALADVQHRIVEKRRKSYQSLGALRLEGPKLPVALTKGNNVWAVHAVYRNHKPFLQISTGKVGEPLQTEQIAFRFIEEARSEAWKGISAKKKAGYR